MSDNFEENLRGFSPPNADITPVTSAIRPQWGEGLYAPINYEAPASAYRSVNTNASGDDGAQRVNADVIRARYEDYERRFRPIEDMAVGLLTENGTKDLDYDLARTERTVGGVFSSMQGQQDRAMERFGQTNTARGIKGSIQETGAMVAGKNTATFSDEARRMKMLGGSSGTASEVARGG